MKKLALLLIVLAACGGGSGSGPDAGAPCDPATTPPTCDGDAVLTCQDGALVPTDCAAIDQVCGETGDGAACMSECDRDGVDATGTCEGDAIRLCVDDHVEVDPCDAGSHCDAGGGAPSCVSDACDTVGPRNRCQGDTLASCASGGLVETDCAATGQVCAYTGDATGYACVDPGTVGALEVDGTVRYEDKAPLVSGALGPITPVVARGARVSIVLDSAPTVAIATTLTADDGTYRLFYDATAGDSVHVLAVSQDPTAVRPLAIVNRSNRVYGQAGASFPAAATATADILATDATGTSEAFNILDQLTKTMDLIRGELGDPTPQSLSAVWARGNNDGTYYDGQIHLLGLSDDDDGYDDTVILHESGHYVEDSEGRSDNPGGSHNGTADDPNLAWSEGFSTYWSMLASGQPLYMDSNSGGGWSYNGDTSVTMAPMPTGTMSQDVSEDMVTEDLWDLGDSGASDDDGVAIGHGEVVRVEPEYLRPGVLRSVGEPGVDLVDFLDGWFLAEGPAPCSAVQQIVTGTRKFPYDYPACQ